MGRESSYLLLCSPAARCCVPVPSPDHPGAGGPTSTCASSDCWTCSYERELSTGSWLHWTVQPVTVD
ncbi:hypothetical protein PsYK624_087120 [Phanerochaete sordida]|uniref:Uncharacterized protein n=1 Tax=Phanerochaete sordida TaxID=48140 RepID=A0A9P3GB67_9APHY|nr:hypothetical protein PsYK624_087120 [Phanerochaete sordida]